MQFAMQRTGCRLTGDILGESRGGRPTVVLLHAGGEHRRVWGPVAVVVQPTGHRVVTLDLRGHGDSHCEYAPSFEEHLADARHLLGWLAEPVVLVGASLGGLLALECAANAGAPPAGVAGLVLVDVVPDPDPALTRAGLSRVLPPQAPQWCLVDEILARAEALRAVAKAVTQPTLVVRAADSFAMGAVDTRRLLGLIPQAKEVVIPGCGHLVAQERPRELAALLLTFLDGMASTPRTDTRRLKAE